MLKVECEIVHLFFHYRWSTTMK